MVDSQCGVPMAAEATVASMSVLAETCDLQGDVKVAKFAYKGIDSEGKETFGLIEADSESDAMNEVGRMGLFIEELRPANAGDEWRAHRQDTKRQREQRLAKKQELSRKRHARQRLVVRYKEGATKCGMCYALNSKDTAFHLDMVDNEGVSSGATEQIRFEDLKAVFYVKSFDGKYDKATRYREWTPQGNELHVEFTDGEVLRGVTVHPYNLNDARFHLIPADPTTNNISILVEASAVKAVYTPDEYKEKREREKEERKKREVSDDLSQEETMGDFYFETRNYPAALEQYGLAAKKFPQSGRIRRKMLASEYNIGVQFIKSRKYAEALAYMDRILKVDPKNAHARKKALQLRKILDRDKQKQKQAEGNP
ncbi:MAG: hypothetical protein GY851_01130 [bacterium]|nr:hypothetical protein [bacterium]